MMTTGPILTSNGMVTMRPVPFRQLEGTTPLCRSKISFRIKIFQA